MTASFTRQASKMIAVSPPVSSAVDDDAVNVGNSIQAGVVW